MTVLVYIGFIVLVLMLLALDLGVLNKKAHAISVKEALGWTAFWISLAMLFNVGVYFMYEHHFLGIGKEIGHELDGKQAALMFLTGYLVEESLSLDNIFVIALIFNFFKIPRVHQHRTLFYGILGAQIMRGIMIAVGAALISRFTWVTYLFGGLLIFTALRLLFQKEEDFNPEQSRLIRLARRLFPVSANFEGERFFTRIDGRLAVTPLFLVLLLIESTDVVFAVDSIPAVFAVTQDPFIVFTSNIFAILGLRSLYFALAAVMGLFRYLKIGLVFLLAFVGVKMLVAHYFKIPTPISLAIIVGILAVSILVSVLVSRREQKLGKTSSEDALEPGSNPAPAIAARSAADPESTSAPAKKSDRRA